MNDASFVRDCECCGNFSANVNDFDRIKCTALVEKVAQRATANKFHDNRVTSVEVDSVINRNDCWVNKPCGCDCFDVKALPHNGIIRELGMKNLHRDSAPKHEVVGFPHFGHSADS